MTVAALATTSRPVPTSSAASAGSSHTVRAGDTLWALAKQHKLSLADLQKANPQVKDARSLKVGSELRIPARGPAVSTASASRASAAAPRTPASARTQQASRARAGAAEQAALAQLQARQTPTLSAAVGRGDSVRRGQTGPAVRELQQALGLAKAQQDGIFGPITDQAVRTFQGKKGLATDGVVGPQTLAALQGKARASAASQVATPAAAQSKAATATTARPADGAQNSAPRIDQHALNHPNNYGFCGVAASLMTLGEAGKRMDTSAAGLRQAASRMYIPGQGSSGAGMANFLSEKGLPSRFTQGGTTADLVKALQQGRAVPVGVDSFEGKVVGSDVQSRRFGRLRAGSSYRHSYGPSGHWVTVTGFKGPANRPTSYIANDPNTGATVELSKAAFDRHAATHKGLWAVLPR